MSLIRSARRIALWIAGGVGVAAAGYATYVAVAWLRYGRADPPRPDERDPLLDRFMPVYDVAERHHVRVAATADRVLEAAREVDMQRSPLIRAIFKARELVLGAEPDTVVRPRGLVEQVTSLGWGVLAEVPSREIVIGSVTQPWLANVVFRALPAEDFAAFREPGYVKIVWTLRADPVSDDQSIFRTETRVVTTDLGSRARFRWYWARFSAGIVLIRRLMLRQLRADAERRA